MQVIHRVDWWDWVAVDGFVVHACPYRIERERRAAAALPAVAVASQLGLGPDLQR